MLPSSLKSVYQQYKADTDSVATWLATTARAHGYANHAPGSKNLPTKSSRKKGKTRRATKPTPPPQPESSPSKAPHVIRIRDFEPMASFVGNIKSVSVPDDFSVALERVIWVRKTFSDRLAASGAYINRASDDRHSFFVGVLEKVRDCLKPLMAPGVFNAAKPSDAAAKQPEDSLRNIWNHAVFALTTLLDDYDRLSRMIRSLWIRRHSDSLDLAAISVATNTAFELARSMEEDIKPLLDKHDGGANLLTAYFAGLCEESGIRVDVREQPGDTYNLKAYGLAKQCLANGISLLTSYASSISGADNIINTYNGKFGWYDEALGDSGATNRAKWSQDSTAFMEIMSDLHFLSSNMGRGAIEDEIIRGIYALMNGPRPRVPLWLAFAIQTYLDILQKLGEDCSFGLGQVQQESLRIKKAMLNVPSDSPGRDSLLSVASKWDKDPIWSCRHQMMLLGSLAGQNPPAFKFLRRNPIHCGLLIHNMRTSFHLSGVQHAAPSGGLMCTMQLYHALRHEKLLPDQVVWEDLEAFWKMQGNPTFFVGDPPTTREGYFRNYCLGIGVSASNWAPAPSKRKAKGKGTPNVNLANRRNMKFNGWVSLTINRRLAPTGERPALSTDLVEGILVEGRRHEAMDGKGHIRPELKRRAEDETPDSMKLSPARLIQKLALEIHAEIPLITFDYFTMHNTAWAFLTKLKEEFTRIFGVGFLQYIPQEDKLPFVVGYVFSTAAGRKSLNSEEEAEPVDSFINAAAQVMRVFLESGQGRVIKDVSETTVKPEEVADLEFTQHDPWRLDKLMAVVQKESRSRGDADLEALSGLGCPTQ
ncbi:hypothetical protein ACJZ2D_003333 [Fusarium nematophilum]